MELSEASILRGERWRKALKRDLMREAPVGGQVRHPSRPVVETFYAVAARHDVTYGEGLPDRCVGWAIVLAVRVAANAGVRPVEADAVRLGRLRW